MNLTYVIKLLKKSFKISDDDFIAFKLSKQKLNPFEFLIGVILSQNTSDRNAIRAFNQLKNLCACKELTPEIFLRIPKDAIKNAIKPAGLHNQRYKTLAELAKKLIKINYIEFFKNADPKEVRDFLLSIKGIGYKTVDVFLLMYKEFPTFPIDTHIRRILKRMGIVKTDNYLKIQEVVSELLPKEYLLQAHLLLIELGRRLCNAKKPKCNSCPINNICPKLI